MADASEEAEARASLALRLRRDGIRDLGVLRAFETVPRRLFVAERDAALAMRDIALPIGCGQTTPPPTVIARALEALGCASGHRVLEVGTGSGFVTALLSQTASEVRSVERFRSLAEEAAGRLDRLGLTGAQVTWDDGLNLAEDGAAFDRIVLHGAVAAAPARLVQRLRDEGVLVYPRLENGSATLIRAVRRGDAIEEQRLGPAVCGAMIAGRSAVL